MVVSSLQSGSLKWNKSTGASGPEQLSTGADGGRLHPTLGHSWHFIRSLHLHLVFYKKLLSSLYLWLWLSVAITKLYLIETFLLLWWFFLLLTNWCHCQTFSISIDNIWYKIKTCECMDMNMNRTARFHCQFAWNVQIGIIHIDSNYPELCNTWL